VLTLRQKLSVTRGAGSAFVRFARWISSKMSALAVKFRNLFVNNLSTVIAQLVGTVAVGCWAGIQVP